MTGMQLAEIDTAGEAGNSFAYEITNQYGRKFITRAGDKQEAINQACAFWNLNPSYRAALRSRQVVISFKGDVLTWAAHVKGYEKLTDAQKLLFEKFLLNFYDAWEYPEKHQPLKVKYIEDTTAYLRVDFTSGGWLHVLEPTQWY